MKKIISLILLSLLVASCAQTSNGVTSGFIYTSWKDRDPISRVDNSVPANKSGKSCVKSTLGIIATGYYFFFFLVIIPVLGVLEEKLIRYDMEKI